MYLWEAAKKKKRFIPDRENTDKAAIHAQLGELMSLWEYTQRQICYIEVPGQLAVTAITPKSPTLGRDNPSQKAIGPKSPTVVNCLDLLQP